MYGCWYDDLGKSGIVAVAWYDHTYADIGNKSRMSFADSSVDLCYIFRMINDFHI